MLGLIVKIRVHPGKGDEFIEAFQVQAKGVRNDEDGNFLYELMRSREDPDLFTAVEIYRDKDAIKAHREAAHMVANRPRVAPLILGDPEFELLHAIGHQD